MRIYGQYVFVCTMGSNASAFGNCTNCSGRAITIVADTKEEAIEKYKKFGGKVDFEKDEIIPPPSYCELMGLNDDTGTDDE